MPSCSPRSATSSPSRAPSPDSGDVADRQRRRLGHVVVDRQPDLVGEPGAGALVVVRRRQRAREEAGRSDGDREVRDAAEMAEDARAASSGAVASRLASIRTSAKASRSMPSAFRPASLTAPRYSSIIVRRAATSTTCIRSAPSAVGRCSRRSGGRESPRRAAWRSPRPPGSGARRRARSSSSMRGSSSTRTTICWLAHAEAHVRGSLLPYEAPSAPRSAPRGQRPRRRRARPRGGSALAAPKRLPSRTWAAARKRPSMSRPTEPPSEFLRSREIAIAAHRSGPALLLSAVPRGLSVGRVG